MSKLKTDTKTRCYYIAKGGKVEDMSTSEQITSFICSNSPIDISSVFC
jgi:hypothetical protein